jgi:hypothetical protein
MSLTQKIKINFVAIQLCLLIMEILVISLLIHG